MGYETLFRKLLLLLCLLLCSCATERRSKLTSGTGFIIDLDTVLSVKELRTSDVFKSVKAVILKNDKTLLGNIDKMQTYGDNLFILDKNIAKGVYVFNKNGDFIRKIGSIGIAPSEYMSCDDFAVNCIDNEIYIYDSYQKELHKYDLASGLYLTSTKLARNIYFDRILFNSGRLYATNVSFDPKVSKDSYFLLQQIDTSTGGLVDQWMDVAQYNRGWKGGFFHVNAFYNVNQHTDLFILGFMDSIMCINDGIIAPYLTIKSKDVIQKEDLQQDINLSIDPIARGNDYMRLVRRFKKENKIYKIDEIFEYRNTLHLSYSKQIRYSIQYNKISNTVSVFDRTKDDLLFEKIPMNYQSPVFLGADEQGVYYCVNPDNLQEMKHFALMGNTLSDRLVNQEQLVTLNEDSNPLILYYEYKE